ncbi:hypothetical protein [Cyclobacterium amurskyense]|uniref:Outer membrane protein beta-barrel domain-containing protein n=1 Tax=Cyclobacterium amurskyense TaxID=320787 RepID=A0A0H4P8T6_9BACT|nr:hypothetical protein [Cyclobacterium amurskyense]AKP50549.1 hypothetical protein CA2015_1099 [Cyclobacterium amurskyense]|tara:strand:- start:4459 stop:5694 length:1236 start_codon:yes stop_codon:yes gene_type:complete
MRITRLLAAAICCFFATTYLVFSQDVSQDYIINQEGHKIYGTIKKSFDFNTITYIPFVSNEGVKTKYYPDDIQGFGLSNGRKFMSRYIPDKEEDGMVFFQIIIKGKVNLLSYKNQYYIENEDYFLELHMVSEKKDLQGNLIRAKDREYMGYLSYMLFGPCGNRLQEKIASTNLSEHELISTFKLYYDCEQEPYELNVKNLPFVRASIIAGAGISFTQSNLTEDSFDEIPHVFDPQYTPYINLGVKLDHWRRLPRFAFDTGIGYTKRDGVINMELFKPNQRYSATEEYSRSSFIVPIFINYLAYRSKNNEFYLGAGAVIRTNTLESKFSIVDHKITYEPVTVRLYEESVLTYSSSKLSPAIKLGINFLYNRRFGIVSEFQLEHISKEYTIDLSSRQSYYNSLVASYMIGFRL